MARAAGLGGIWNADADRIRLDVFALGALAYYVLAGRPAAPDRTSLRERLRRAGHEVVGYDRDPKVSDVRTMAAMVKALTAPRVVWVMVPSGAPTRDTIAKLADMMDKGDLIIDGGNSRFTDDFEHAKMLKPKGIGYVDCGVSGGIWGLDNGYGLMCGGDKKWVNLAMPIFDALRRIDRGAGGELQLTDAIALLIKEGHPVHVVVHRGSRHDLGNPGGYLKAAVDFALDRDDYGPELRRWLVERLGLNEQ